MFYGALLCTSVLLIAGVNAAGKQKSNIGQCTSNSDCDLHGWKESQCISVDTDQVELIDLNQCTPKMTCAGTKPGNCPIFTNHPNKPYRSVQPMCTVFEVDNCEGVSNATETVYCLPVQVGSETKHVIYGCKDREKYEKTSIFGYKRTQEQIKGCINPKSTGNDELCTGAGTCGPEKANNHTSYQCYCLHGYNGQYCENVQVKECTMDTECTGNGYCDTKSSQCICNIGSTGNKCQFCTAAKEGCSGNGKCNTKDGTCVCQNDFTGKYCDTKVQQMVQVKKDSAGMIMPSTVLAFGLTAFYYAY